MKAGDYALWRYASARPEALLYRVHDGVDSEDLRHIRRRLAGLRLYAAPSCCTARLLPHDRVQRLEGARGHPSIPSICGGCPSTPSRSRAD